MYGIKKVSIIVLMAIVISLFTAQTGFSLYMFNRNNNKEIQKSLAHRVEKEALYVFSELIKMEEASISFAEAAATVPQYNEEILFSLLEKYIDKEHLIVGGGFWLEPFEYDKTQKYFGPYMYKEDKDIILTWDYSNEKEDYFQYDWYKSGIETDKRAVWSEPYSDAVSGVAMITSTAPINKNGVSRGVVTIDVGLDQLQQYISDIKVGKEGYAFLVTKEGYYLGHRDEERNLKMKITEDNNTEIAELGKRLVSGDNSFSSAMKFEGEKNFIVSRPVGNSGLSLILIMPTKEAYAATKKLFMIMVIIMVIMLCVFSIVLERLISKHIVQPVNTIKERINQMAKGDFSVEIKTNSSNRVVEFGEIHKSLVNMQQSIKDIIKSIIETSHQVALSSEELTSISKQTVATAHEVGKAVEEISRAADIGAQETQQGAKHTNLLGKLIVKNQESMNNLNHSASEVDILKEEGIEVLNNLIEKTIENARESEEIHNIIIKTNESTEKIKNASQMIKNIARQTNLLALNASIEAARAGEEGRGFAVVAEEIKKLAEQSNDFTDEIEEVINELLDKTKNAVDTIEKATKLTAVQTQSVNSTQAKFEGITRSIDHMKEIIILLNESGSDMERKKIEMIKIIEELAEISQENAASTEEVVASIEEQVASMGEVARASEHLAVLARNMQESISAFKY